MTLAISDTSIETERLVLRRITTADLSFFTRIHADPDVARYIGYGRPRSADETRVWLDRILETYELFQLGQLAVVRKSDGGLIGRCGMAYLAIDDNPADGGEPAGYFDHGEAPVGVSTRLEPELGYTFDRAAWGQGFAREAAGAVFAYAKPALNGARIASLIHPLNVRSQRLARSFGATPGGRVRAFGGVLDRHVWPT
jgi:[ribosomal protein S5]-alanine N-acetyltransferase